jgi:hypothetical protein
MPARYRRAAATMTGATNAYVQMRLREETETPYLFDDVIRVQMYSEKCIGISQSLSATLRMKATSPIQYLKSPIVCR